MQVQVQVLRTPSLNLEGKAGGMKKALASSFPWSWNMKSPEVAVLVKRTGGEKP